jgi:hypothetical protein
LPKGRCLREANAVIAGVRSPPLRGDGLSRVRWPSGGNPGWRAGGFLGGARSPRPGGRAGGEPRHVVITDQLATGPWPKRGQFWVWRNAFLCGRAEPAPPRRGQAGVRSPFGGRPRNAARGGFLGGARSPRPGGRAGGEPRHVVIRDELERGRWPNGGTFRLALCRHHGRAEPAPPRGARPR